MRDVKILFVFGSIWEKGDEIGDQRIHLLYRDRLKGLQILLSRTQAGPGRSVKEEQE